MSGLSGGGLGITAEFSLGVFKVCKIDGDSEGSVFNGSWFSISPSGGLVVFVVSAFSCKQSSRYFISVFFLGALVAIIFYNLLTGGGFLLGRSGN